MVEIRESVRALRDGLAAALASLPVERRAEVSLHLPDRPMRADDAAVLADDLTVLLESSPERRYFWLEEGYVTDAWENAGPIGLPGRWNLAAHAFRALYAHAAGGGRDPSMADRLLSIFAAEAPVETLLAVVGRGHVSGICAALARSGLGGRLAGRGGTEASPVARLRASRKPRSPVTLMGST
jgi:hypothetical protein